MKKPELLAPAGSYETLECAILAGADAVYLGGKLYNARMNAKNFDSEAMKRAVDLCHKNGVRLYVTLNTLIYDRCFKDALLYAEELYKQGVDALITADVGFSKKLHEYLPDFELHASTQMTGHNVSAAEYLARMGFSRMVCAREMQKKDIAYLVEKSPIEIEAFVHGAMCVCQSGQCLMSSFIGGRSGNRGECAQPCRLPYNNAYPISLKDMCLGGHITELAEMGVASLKIEGRMKSPDYVYSVVSTYRRLLDENRNATQKEIDRLASVFSRGGFSDGYFIGKVDNSMLGIRSSGDKEATKNTSIKQTKVGAAKDAIMLQERNGSLPSVIEIDTDGDRCEKINSARFFNVESIPKSDYFDIIYLPLEKFDGTRANGIVMPPVIFDSEKERVERLLEVAKKKGALHCLVGNVGHIELAKKYGFIIHGDYRLNIYNNTSFANYSDMKSILVSPELTLAQIRDIKGKKSVVVYGKVPLMTLEKRTGQRVLRDRKRVVFPVFKESGREIVVNSVPIYMADKEDALRKSGIFDRHFIFTTETKEEVLAVIKAHKEKKIGKNNVKRIK
ncbi:MAG: U32 family peptidase [Ruminococcaceae bacterium]|nr:U32 family peptidase [Oscillospiraceae bacterium]